MASIEDRGKHATGVAVCDGPKPFIWKVAETFSKVKDSKPWAEVVMPAITDDMTTMIGHTRWSSHSHNSHLDACAHPFRMGEVVGAHNGVIRNWKEVESDLKPDVPWAVDSQAAFALLDKEQNPAKALKRLSGYFALTWWKGGRLYMARSSAPLAYAYLPEYEIVVWHSVKQTLIKVLVDFGVRYSDFEVWELQPGSIYRFSPVDYDAKKAHAEIKRKAFNPEEAPRNWNSAKPTMNIVKAGGPRWSTTDGTNYQKIEKPQGIDVSAIAKEVESRIVVGNGVSFIAIKDEMVRLYVEQEVNRIAIASMKRRIEALEEHVEQLIDLAVDADSGTTEELNRMLRDVPEPPNLFDEATCDRCCTGEDEKKGPLLTTPGGGRVHTKCVLLEN